MTKLDKSAETFLNNIQVGSSISLTEMTAVQARDNYELTCHEFKNPLEKVKSVNEIVVNGLRLKYWRGQFAPDKDSKALIYLHGGGWLFGSPETHEDICRKLANRANAVVIAPQYRLAPEYPFPAGLDDCSNALNYVYENPERFGIDQNRISVGGDSSGGNLATVLAIMSRDGDLPTISSQLLMYPNTDQSHSFESYSKFANGFGLSSEEMSWFRDHYLSGGHDVNSWKLSPLQVTSLTDVASTAIVIAGHDILCDEGKLYAERLKSESEAIVSYMTGQIHGFVSLEGVIPEASVAINFLCESWLKFEA